jgi:hypothetical protein
MAAYSGDYSHNIGAAKSSSLAVPQAGRPAPSSRKASHASGVSSIDLKDGDDYYAEGANGEQDADLPLEIETFQAPDFNVGRLVSGLTDSLIAQSKQGGGGEDGSISYL